MYHSKYNMHEMNQTSQTDYVDTAWPEIIGDLKKQHFRIDEFIIMFLFNSCFIKTSAILRIKYLRGVRSTGLPSTVMLSGISKAANS